MEKIQFTRQELYDLVWSEPLSRLAKKYLISDNGLKKICKRMNIPLPVSGHWRNIKYGHKVKRPKLSTKYDGVPLVRLQYRKEDGSYVKPEIPKKSILKKEIQNDPKLSFKVSDRLTNPDPLVYQAQQSLIKDKPSNSLYKGVVSTRSGELHIRVKPTNIGRALRFMDAFIKMLHSRKHEIRKNSSGKICAIISTIEFEISFKEKLTIVKTPNKYGNMETEYHPTGVLAFIVGINYSLHEWRDGKQLIEEKLSDILVYLELKSDEILKSRKAFELRLLHQREEEQKRKEFIARKQKELTDFEDLFNQSMRWQQARFMRDYLSTVIQYTKDNRTTNAELNNWIRWAKQKIDWYDPLVKASDDLLDDSDRRKMVEAFKR